MLRFRKFSGSKKFIDKKGEGRRECQNFLSEIFCLTVPKVFVGNPSVFH